MKFLYVSQKEKQSKDDFTSITTALASLPEQDLEPVTIFLRKGIYTEKVSIDRPFVTLEGEDKDSTIITFGDYALMIMEDGTKRGTFRTPTVFVDADDFTAKNLTFENNAGFGRKVGQALAIYVDGDRIQFENCKLLGSQDTLFTAPLPPTAMQANGFTGPKEFSIRKNGRHYYHRCYIRGDVDFIFGSAAAYFEDCELFSQKTDDLPPAASSVEQKIYGYVTAASTPEGQPYGYVFHHCRLTGNCPKASVYLGRPWRNYAKTIFMNCELGDHIHPSGWHDWNKPEAQETIFYAEYKNYGSGADCSKRVPFSKQLSDREAELLTRELVLAGPDYWLPKPLLS